MTRCAQGPTCMPPEFTATEKGLRSLGWVKRQCGVVLAQRWNRQYSGGVQRGSTGKAGRPQGPKRPSTAVPAQHVTGSELDLVFSPGSKRQH
ncbi:hypothetical protein NDU88_001818 [Pleurodeles waltl]|uniref:Uncharacterized protein n=1 Tax=Pleurodeles waltl TaxID=8319 RepID=A0AAV7P9V6_PLEWA|nr:hypothetical protein NDU88_001818 [Pleurodeles waltl]